MKYGHDMWENTIMGRSKGVSSGWYEALNIIAMPHLWTKMQSQKYFQGLES